MPNIFKTEEQRKHWNKYNTEYSRKTYRTMTIKLRKKEDAKIIEWLDSFENTTTTNIVRKLVLKEIEEKDEEE